MIPGLNSNVTHGGIDYHVQTEDLGRENPYLLTLVFHAGAIIARQKVNYREALGKEASEARVKTFMDRQHQRVIQDILAGQLQAPAPDPGAAPPAPPTDGGRPGPSRPAKPPTAAKPSLPSADKTLDQLIAEYLHSRNPGKPR